MPQSKHFSVSVNLIHSPFMPFIPGQDHISTNAISNTDYRLCITHKAASPTVSHLSPPSEASVVNLNQSHLNPLLYLSVPERFLYLNSHFVFQAKR